MPRGRGARQAMKNIPEAQAVRFGLQDLWRKARSGDSEAAHHLLTSHGIRIYTQEEVDAWSSQSSPDA